MRNLLIFVVNPQKFEMTFDNRNIVTRLNMRRYLSLIIYFISMVILLLDEVIRKPIFGYEKELFAFIITVIYMIYVIYTFILNYNFFLYSDNGDKFVIRFASLRPFDNRKRAIELNKNDFGGYKITNSFLNLKKELILKLNTKNGLAKYPAISITALSKKQIQMLEKSLKQTIKT